MNITNTEVMRPSLNNSQKKNSALLKNVKNYWLLYAMLLPVLAWYLLFCYLPMGGVILAFKSYQFNLGIWGSPFVGFTHFQEMFQDSDFLNAFKNTLIFSFGSLLIQFPFPIIIAILLNEIRLANVKKFFQTVFTFPHFISWVVLAGIFADIFASDGIVNQILATLGLSGISPLTSPAGFRPFVWLSGLGKEFGWNTIIYLAALTSIDPQLYEAAEIDGANRWQKMRYVTWPGIRGCVCIMLILAVGNIMGGASFDQIYNLYTVPVYPVGDIISTYVFRQSFEIGTDFGYTTAVGLLQSVIGIIMLTLADRVISKTGEQGLF